jgi:hypothetical protein
MRKKASLKNVLPLVILICLVPLLIVNGCGGGSGGRQTLPGENPLGPGDPTPDPTPDPDPEPDPDPPTPAEQIEAGWKDMDADNPFAAISKFTTVINNPDATTAEKAEAYNGRGWARTRAYGVSSGISDFIQGGDLVPSRLGHALALIQTGRETSVRQAVDIMESIGLGEPTFNLVFNHQDIVKVSSAYAHAMLSYAYFWRNSAGDEQKARDQINAARSSDTSESSVVGQIHSLLVKAGLTGI